MQAEKNTFVALHEVNVIVRQLWLERKAVQNSYQLADAKQNFQLGVSQ